MDDPLSQIIQLLQPRTVFAKRISGAGKWGVRYSEFGQPSFSIVLEGRCRLAVDGQRPIIIEAGDFILLPATPGFMMSSLEPGVPKRIDPKGAPFPTDEVRHGTRGGPPDVRLLGGFFVFDTPDAALLVSLLPALVHVRGVDRLSTLVRLVGDDSRERRSGRELVLVAGGPADGRPRERGCAGELAPERLVGPEEEAVETLRARCGSRRGGVRARREQEHREQREEEAGGGHSSGCFGSF